ncbi:ParB family chromosome partitioning protein [Hydrogenispora ethanolica]|uniref:ParB family chromosome partitioning protein n=1 Tax=Hydrogenispora ethanolica TaxID=1082276 RepID=A0A4R1S9Z9_HYDET|nr:ParB/RepB/Spo0J family partition protein [Hydrogenispora ethanolica]TCL76323.1 ParB family chromosome partitioning protein [Hydrogenispora ethanolica]
MVKNRGLGKGLGALIPELNDANFEKQSEIQIDLITPNPFQPRKEFSDEKLQELAESIRTHGVIQPLVVREVQGKYQLIAGERRLRASKIAGLTMVPVYILSMTDQTMMEAALVENLQREDLNPIEAAEAFQRLMDEFHLTQDEIAKKVGKSRSAIANFLRLLNLPQEIRKDLANGVLSMGHARAILGLSSAEEQMKAWILTRDQQLSVRQTEDLVKKLNERANVSRETNRAAQRISLDPIMTEIEEKLQHTFGTKVKIKPSANGGKIEIDYYSDEDFNRIYEQLVTRIEG